MLIFPITARSDPLTITRELPEMIQSFSVDILLISRIWWQKNSKGIRAHRPSSSSSNHLTRFTTCDKGFIEKKQIIGVGSEILPIYRSYGTYIGLKVSAKTNASFSKHWVLKKSRFSSHLCNMLILSWEHNISRKKH